jgi:hypothetical protein
MTAVIDALHAAARVLLLLAVLVGSGVLLWGLLREPIGQLVTRLAREPAPAGGWLRSDDDDIPRWAALVGGVLILGFLYLSASAYFGLPTPALPRFGR